MASGWGNFLKGAAGGAGMGSLLGAPGMVVGGVLGGLFGLGGKSDEEVYAQRKRELEREINALYDKRLARGARLLNQQSQGAQAMNKEAAARRALSLGRSTDAESFILPGQAQIGNAAGGQMRQFVEGTETARDEALLGAEGAYAARPIEPEVSDYLFELGKGAIAYKQNQDFLDTYKDTLKTGGADQPTFDLSGNETGAPGIDRAAEQQMLQDTLLQSQGRQTPPGLAEYQRMLQKAGPVKPMEAAGLQRGTPFVNYSMAPVETTQVEYPDWRGTGEEQRMNDRAMLDASLPGRRVQRDYYKNFDPVKDALKGMQKNYPEANYFNAYRSAYRGRR